MSTINFGYNNLVDDSGVAITHSTEVSGFAAENVQAVQASQKLRSSVVNPAWIEFDLQTQKYVQLAAIFGSNAPPHRNALQKAHDLDNATYWTATGWTAQESTIGLEELSGVPIWSLTEPGTPAACSLVSTALTGMLAGTGTGNSADGWEMRVSCVLRLTGTSPGTDRTFILKAGVSGLASYAEYRFFWSDSGSTLTAASPASNGWAAPTNAAVETIDSTNGYYRISFTTASVSSSTSLQFSLAMSGSVGNASYWVAAPQVEMIRTELQGGSKGVIAYDGTENAAYWRIRADATDTTSGQSYDETPGALALRHELTGRSTIDTYYKLNVAAAQAQRLWRIDVFDANNADTWVDIGRVFLGPVWQPTVQTVTLLDHDYINGRRRNTYGLNFITKSEATGAVATMRRTLDIRPGQQWESMDGQISRPRTGAVVVIANPAETTNADQELIYGYLNSVSSVYRQSGRGYSVTHGEPMFQFTCEVEEIIA